MHSADPHIASARLQKDISLRLDLPLDNLIFNYETVTEGIKLELITINPKHAESFLYHTEIAPGKLEALEKMLEYVNKTSQVKQSYTVQWTQRGKGGLHTSYFRARDAYEVLDKFYHGRSNKEDYVIFSLTLNPVA
ncbi:MAG: hypothetical protein AAFV07_10645 [Bacteroidota bacterium]